MFDVRKFYADLSRDSMWLTSATKISSILHEYLSAFYCCRQLKFLIKALLCNTKLFLYCWQWRVPLTIHTWSIVMIPVLFIPFYFPLLPFLLFVFFLYVLPFFVHPISHLTLCYSHLSVSFMPTHIQITYFRYLPTVYIVYHFCLISSKSEFLSLC